jgi:hypothetical protein
MAQRSAMKAVRMWHAGICNQPHCVDMLLQVFARMHAIMLELVVRMRVLEVDRRLLGVLLLLTVLQ